MVMNKKHLKAHFGPWPFALQPSVGGAYGVMRVGIIQRLLPIRENLLHPELLQCSKITCVKSRKRKVAARFAGRPDACI